MSEPLLSVEGLRVSFPGKGWRAPEHEVLHGVDLHIEAGRTHGLVGGSGSGKTTIGRAILGLVPVAGGSITFDGRPIHAAGARQRRRLSRDIQVIFQDPFTSLNPSMTIGDTLAEPLLAQRLSSREARSRVAGLLDDVALPADAMDRLPREFSGGQRQRIAIARALAIGPRLIVCDEPVSALDLTTQRTVLDLLQEVQRTTGVAYLFVSHDLAVVRHVSDVVSVIRRGEIVESGTAVQVTERPQHPYTRRLLLSAPVADPAAQRVRREAYRREFAGTEA
ncbi:peptide/nickel transport system ATP-binding protein [Blastococcus aurantiacus]|uniref:Peptide/nickel transport system ATP-binding protein n=1 Tax=Blastococcus aurantiacus TaxID=1550231 RepID=A0A1G7NRL9_9ACTN|nr:ATP-binding cassette domain-containing protein [Blastococcus aurantiacus]SDF76694.1 peptide/nickel transport system ATP-binding protein [Blastococcus aurantiacus]